MECHEIMQNVAECRCLIYGMKQNIARNINLAESYPNG